MPKDLTQIAIERLKPSTVRAEVPDGAVRGLRLVIQPSGHKSWAVRYRKADGRSAKVTLGAYPAIDLKTARAKAREAIGARDQGIDPGEAKKTARAAAKARAKPAPTETTGPAITSFITRHAKVKNREAVWREAERILNRELEPWRERRLADIGPADIHDLLDGKVEGGAPIAANRTLAVLRRFFRWAVERQIIAASPCADIGAPAPTRSRDRVLEDAEIAEIWKAAGTLPHPFGPLMRLLILTGQRRGEVAGIEWGELDLDAGLWTIPAAKAKNGKAHVVHLAAPALAILREVEREPGRVGRFVFGQPVPEDSLKGPRPPSGFSKAKRRIDDLLADADRQTSIRLGAWVVHDIRRSVATGLARHHVALPVVERILNHVSGTFGGVQGIYQRHNYLEERKAALDLWAHHVEGVVRGRPADGSKGP